MDKLGLGFLIESIGAVILLISPILGIITWKKRFLILSLIGLLMLMIGYTITIL